MRKDFEAAGAAVVRTTSHMKAIASARPQEPLLMVDSAQWASIEVYRDEKAAMAGGS